MKTALISRIRVKNISNLLFIITVFWVSVAAAEEVAIFNGKDLSGWETVDPQYWSVENGVIKGSSDKALPRNTFIWSKIPVEDFYFSVDVKLEPENSNAGIQFRRMSGRMYGAVFITKVVAVNSTGVGSLKNMSKKVTGTIMRYWLWGTVSGLQ